MSYIKKLWFEEGLYPTEDFDFGEEFFENDYDFFDIDDDAPVEGDDDGKFNFGSLDDNEPHAVGDYDMNEDGLTIDYDFYDIDDDPPVTGEDDGRFNFIDSEDEPEAEGDYDFNKDIPVDPDPENNIDFYDIDEDPPVVGPDDEVFNMGDLNPNDVPLPDYDFYSVDDDPPVEGEDDGKWNFGNIEEDVPHAEGDYNYGDFDDLETAAQDDYDFGELHEDGIIIDYDMNDDSVPSVNYNFGELNDNVVPSVDYDMNDDSQEVDYDFHDQDVDPAPDEDDDCIFNFRDLDYTDPEDNPNPDDPVIDEDEGTFNFRDLDFTDPEDHPRPDEIIDDDDGQFNFIDTEDEPEAEGDYNFGELTYVPILVNEINDIISICTALYMEGVGISEEIPVLITDRPVIIDDDDNTCNFLSIDDDAPLTDPDDFTFNFGDEDDNVEPHAIGDYNFFDEDDEHTDLPDGTDSNFYDIDEDPPVTGEDDGRYDFHNIEKYEPFATKKYNFYDLDEIYTDIVDETDFDFAELEDRPILVNEINDIISISLANYIYSDSELNKNILITERPVIIDDDDLVYNFGDILDDEPHAVGDYNMEVGSEDYNFYNIDEDGVISYDMNADGRTATLPENDIIAVCLANYIYEDMSDTYVYMTFGNGVPEDYNFGDEDVKPVVEEDDDHVFDFGDEDHTDTDILPIIDDDDGSFNFIENTYDDPCSAVGDYNFFELDEIESEVIDEYDYDFGDEDIAPVADEEDDGEFNFLYIEDDYDVEDFHEWDWDFNVDDIPIDMDALPEEEGTDWDFGEIEEEDGWDFWDISEHPDVRHSQFDIDYDFGEEEKVGWILTRDTIRKYIEDSIEELLHRTDVPVTDVDVQTQMIYPYITYQYFYNERTNKSFIEFNVCNTDNLFDRDKLMMLIKTKIVNQFKLDTDIWPELVNDDIYDRSGDTAYSVTPYTIGYWKSVNGYYEAIEDKAEVEMDLNDKQLPPMRVANIWTLYQVAENISRRYNLIKDLVSKANKEIYIKEAMNIMTQYHDPQYKDIYNQKMQELKQSYLTNNYDNSKLPDAVSEYMTWYREYFDANMPQVHMFTRRHYLQVGNI